MSRIGKLPIAVPSGVDVAIDESLVTVKGPKGTLSHTIAAPITVAKGEDGILEVQRAGRTERFDLTSHYTKIRTVGRPRSGRWRVLIERPANTPFVIDRTMVNPRDFTRVLEAYHHVV